MPHIDFNFQGYVRGANVEIVYDVGSGEEVDVSKLTADEVASKLKAGMWTISLVDYLHEDVRHTEIEISDYEAHRS
jgi:hypothetical protein